MIINTMELTNTELINLSGFEKYVSNKLEQIEERLRQIELRMEKKQ